MEKLKIAHSAVIGAGFWLLLATCFYLYSFGFCGAFMFDDFPNLEPLGHWGDIDSFEEVRTYLASGFSGPTGRPVALASFLIDSNTWPAEPCSFKRTNVLFHLLTASGVLLFLIRFMIMIKPSAHHDGRILLGSVCVAGLWLLHPFWVSTSLYVIQRMAILSAMFGIFSLWCYLLARYEVVKNGSVNGRAITWIATAAALFILGVFSKENLLVLPACVLVLELSLQSRSPIKSSIWKWLIVVGCVLPSVLLLGYLGYRGVIAWDVIDSRRGLSTADRMLTQGRVLWTYLFNIFIPQPYTGGLYTEVLTSVDWVDRFLGMLGWFAFLLLVAWTWLLRRRWPLFFPGIALYLVGHLIESTVIPLELYFEHRNYFPGIFLTLIPLQLSLTNSISRLLTWLFSLTTLAVFAILLWMRASLWADYPSLVASWARESPDSVRAQLETSKIALQFGDAVQAFAYFERARDAEPEDLRVKLWGVFVACSLSGRISEEYTSEITLNLSSAPDSGGVIQYLTVLVEKGSSFQCAGLTRERLEDWIEAYLSSEKTAAKTDWRLKMLLGVNAVKAGLPDKAVQYFKEGVWGLRSVNSGILAVSHLASASYLGRASDFLDDVSQAYETGALLGADVDYSHEIDNLRQILSND